MCPFSQRPIYLPNSQLRQHGFSPIHGDVRKVNTCMYMGTAQKASAGQLYNFFEFNAYALGCRVQCLASLDFDLQPR